MSSTEKPTLPFSADFDLEELMSTHSTVINIDPLETMEMEEEAAKLIEQCNDMQLERSEEKFAAGMDAMGKPLRGTPGAEPFSKYAEKMTNVTGDGKVKKQVLRKGNGMACPENANVVVLYNAYLQFGQLPYDTTYSHGKPLKCSLDDFVEGLGIGIRTMMKKEQAQFLIHPDMAYRALGVPPRIPKNATILYEVELVDFTEIKVKEESDQDQASAKVPKTKFEETLASSRKGYTLGNECFKKDDYREAIQNYKKALHSLEKCSLANDSEQEAQERLLVRLYVNLAMCWNKISKPRSACNMCRAAIRLDSKNIKALISWGRALMLLSEFPDARAKLNRALNLEPGSKDILDELETLNDKEKAYKAQENLFATKAFSS